MNGGDPQVMIVHSYDRRPSPVRPPTPSRRNGHDTYVRVVLALLTSSVALAVYDLLLFLRGVSP